METSLCQTTCTIFSRHYRGSRGCHVARWVWVRRKRPEFPALQKVDDVREAAEGGKGQLSASQRSIEVLQDSRFLTAAAVHEPGAVLSLRLHQRWPHHLNRFADEPGKPVVVEATATDTQLLYGW